MADREGLLEAVLSAHRSLLRASSLEETVPPVLEEVGRAAEVDRAYVFQHRAGADNELLASQRFEWVAEGVTPEQGNPELQDVPLRSGGYGRWVDSFLQFKPVYGLIADFPESERPLLEEQGIQSLLVLPIFENAALWGFVGFDDCSSRREWTEHDVDLLLSVAISLGAVLSRDRMLAEDRGSRTTGLSEQAEAYAAMIGGLLDMRAVAAADMPLSELMERTQGRIRGLVRCHEFILSRFQDDLVYCDRFVSYLRRHLEQLHGCCRGSQGVLEFSVQPVPIDPDKLLPLGLILTELLGSLCCRAGDRLEVSGMTVSVRSSGSAAELTVTGKDPEGVPLAPEQPMDVLGLVLVRRLAQTLNARLVQADTEGMLFRLSFPVDALAANGQ
jgi:two-component sensor histidine kinase